MKIEFIANEAGDLVKQTLKQNPQLNFNQLQMAFRKKDVKLNGERLAKSSIINVGDKVEIFLPQAKPAVIDIVYQDENILVVNKPAGMEVTEKDKVFSNSKCLEELTNQRAVHRIDKNTQGLVVLAKNQMAYDELLDAFKNGYVKKYYQTIVCGKPKQKQAFLTAYLKKDVKNSIVKIFDKKEPNSVEIKTNYHLIKTNGELSLLFVKLLTGKTHQIRAHLAHESLAVLGDEKYGNKQLNKKYSQKKQCLCACEIAFSFPSKSKLSYLNNIELKIEPNFQIKI